MRVDKVTIAALQEVLRASLFSPDGRGETPALGQILGDPSRQRQRADDIVDGLQSPQGVEIRVCDDEAAVGGGSLSAEAIASAAVAIRCRNESEATQLARRMRLGSPPLFTRIRGDEVRINMTTILPGEEDALRDAIARALAI